MTALFLLSLVTFSILEGGDLSPAENDVNQTILDKLRSKDGYFTENRGQVADGIKYYSRGNPSVAFRDDGVMFVLTEFDEARDDSDGRWKDPTLLVDSAQVERVPLRSYAYMMHFEGANKVAPVGIDELSFKSNFFIGNEPSAWRTGVPNYRAIVYHGLYEGVDLVYRVVGGNPKYEFRVEPSAEPARITMSYEGLDRFDVESDGVSLGASPFALRESPPYSYDSYGTPVTCSFVRRGARSLGFDCTGWDHSSPLIIDPLIYATFLGGGGWDEGWSIQVDAGGNAYVAGKTYSPDFPSTPGSYDIDYDVRDAFLVKLAPSGDALVYATFLGGSREDTAYAVALDAANQTYLTGLTISTDFPTTAGAFDRTYSGGFHDAFVAKLSAAGDALVYSTFLGGAAGDIGYSIATDATGTYVSGITDSPDFPVTPSAFDTTFAGGTYGDAFVAKLNVAGSALQYATYLGGADNDNARSIAVPPTGNATVTGYTRSPDFPTTPGAFDRSYNGGTVLTYGDAFVARLDTSGSALEYGTFIGGADEDGGNAIALDPDGNMYVTGMSYSSDFPLTPGTFDCVNTRGDGFVVKINALGDSLIYSTFLGGNNFDQGISIALDGSGDSYVGGHTWSTDFPVTPGGFDTTPNPPDSFIARINAEGTSVLNATYLGGSNGDDVVYGVAIGPSGNLYATGNTLSTDFPVTPGAFDTTPNGYYDAIAVRLNMSAGSENQPPMILTFSATPAKEGSAAILTVDARDSDGDALTYDFDFESDGVFDVSGPSSTATHIYGDDFNGTATMRVSDGNLSTEATTPVIVLNVPPTIDGVITATATFDVTLRVAGEKWHDVTATVYLNGAEYATASVVRMSGSPNDQAVTIANVTLDLASSDTWSARVVYTPPDDPVNGQMNGANPAWLVFTAKDGSESRLHHTFNVRHNDTWVWEVPDLRAMLVGFPIEFAATATDQGSDDLTFTWDWGDGSPATATIYYNDGIGPDPYPSPGGTFPFAATDSEAHAYQAAGMYELKLIVRDDDGGTTEIPLVVVIV